VKLGEPLIQVESCESTQALLDASMEEGSYAVADFQTAGRGRLGRTWETPPRAALTFSALVRPVSVPERRWPWLTLLTGVAVVEGLARAGAPGCRLKWPNDVLVNDLKVGGLLAERVPTPDGPAVVLGVGLNVTTTPAELPVETATSLALAGMTAPDRTRLLLHLLDALAGRLSTWESQGGDPDAGLAADYRDLCATLGRRVAVRLPDGEVVEGVAASVDRDGGLVLETGAGSTSVSAGDVVHLRPAG